MFVCCFFHGLPQPVKLFSNCYLRWHSLGQEKALPGTQGPWPTTECAAVVLPFSLPHQLWAPEAVPSLGAGKSNLASTLSTATLPQLMAEGQWPRVLQTLCQRAHFPNPWLKGNGQGYCRLCASMLHVPGSRMGARPPPRSHPWKALVLLPLTRWQLLGFACAYPSSTLLL